MINESIRKIIPSKWIIFFLPLWFIFECGIIALCTQLSWRKCQNLFENYFAVVWHKQTCAKDESSMKLRHSFLLSAVVLSLVSKHDELALIMSHWICIVSLYSFLSLASICGQQINPDSHLPCKYSVPFEQLLTFCPAAFQVIRPVKWYLCVSF